MLAQLAAAVALATVSGGAWPEKAEADCIASDPADPSFCVRKSETANPYRLGYQAGDNHSTKMDAYRFDGAPCQIIGRDGCPMQGRPIWRAGQSVVETILPKW